jgi:hypothetical protein
VTTESLAQRLASEAARELIARTGSDEHEVAVVLGS